MKYIYLKTIGTIETSIVEDLKRSLSLLIPFSLRCVYDNEYPLFAFEPKRNQYYAKKIIAKLVSEIPHDCEKLIAITDVDLCTPVLTFVYGEAQLGGKVAIVSVNRLEKEYYYLPPGNTTLLVERLVKECIHELGHCYGLFHCHDSQCVMFFSNSIFTIDNKQKRFCMKCKKFFERQMGKEHNHAEK
jgi:archaemetzincin